MGGKMFNIGILVIMVELLLGYCWSFVGIFNGDGYCKKYVQLYIVKCVLMDFGLLIKNMGIYSIIVNKQNSLSIV